MYNYHIILFSVTLQLICATEYYVKPQNGISCPENSMCHELSFYASSDVLVRNDTIVYFLTGTHILDKSIYFTGITNLSIQQTLGSSSEAVVQCENSSYEIIFEDISSLVINGISFNDCVINISSSVDVSLTGLTATGINVNSRGLTATNVFHLTVLNVTFLYESMLISYTMFDNLSDNLAIYPLVIRDVHIRNSSGISGGLLITLNQGYQYVVYIELDSVVAVNNIGPNIGIYISEGVSYQVIISHVTCVGSVNGHLKAEDILKAESPSKSGLMIVHTVSVVFTQTWECVNCTIKITDSIFTNNSNGGVYLGAASLVTMSNCLIENNQYTGLWLQSVNSDSGYHPLVAAKIENHFNIINTTISSTTSTFLNPRKCALCVLYTNGVTLNNIKILHNMASGIYIAGSLVVFQGRENFIYKNYNKRGGGISIDGQSVLILDGEVVVYLEKNLAGYAGGGIHLPSHYKGCFFHTTSPNSFIVFKNNTAKNYGSAIYGDIYPACYSQSFALVYEDFGNSEPVVTSDAFRTCFCVNNTPNCDITTFNTSAIPGETLYFDVIPVNNLNIPTGGFIALVRDEQASIVDHNSNSSMCSTIDVYITADDDKAVSTRFHLFSQVDFAFRLVVEIIVQFEECPLGFTRSNDTGICECIDKLLRDTTNNISCNVTTQEISRFGHTWIGALERNHNETYDTEYNLTRYCIVKQYCSDEFCNPDLVSFSLQETSIQCSGNRDGFMCGGCAEGYSLILGSNECRRCDNNNLALFIYFALAGILLVILIMSLNLTVSTATINGFIFWANVIQIYEYSLGLNGLGRIVIYNLNFDFGFPACFYNGMEACGKTGLQFIFPIYLWLLMGLVTIVCHYSERIAKVIGPRIVPTFSTVLLISYTKLLRTVILVFYRVNITCGDTTRYYWQRSPNIPYYSPCHAGLIFVAIVVLLVLIVPYTLLLLLFPLFERVQFLQKPACIQKTLNKLKPFRDAYGGPYTNNFRFWTGLLLVVRIFLAMVVSLSSDTSASLTVLLAVCMVLILFLSTGYVYDQERHRWLHILEIWMLLNLVALIHIIKVHTDIEKNVQYTGPLAYLIAVMNVFVLCAIIIYHIYKYLFLVQWIKKCIKERIAKKKEAPVECITSRERSLSDGSCRDSVGSRLMTEMYRGSVLREPVLSFSRETTI